MEKDLDWRRFFESLDSRDKLLLTEVVLTSLYGEDYIDQTLTHQEIESVVLHVLSTRSAKARRPLTKLPTLWNAFKNNGDVRIPLPGYMLLQAGFSSQKIAYNAAWESTNSFDGFNPSIELSPVFTMYRFQRKKD